VHRCHDLKPVVSLKQSQSAWKELVVKMVGFGAQLDDKEVDVATEYLTKHYCGHKTGYYGREDRREIHQRHLLLLSRRRFDPLYTGDERFDIVARMNGLDAGVSARDVDVLVDYLASKYGRK